MKICPDGVVNLKMHLDYGDGKVFLIDVIIVLFLNIEFLLDDKQTENDRPPEN